jgi:hypothetical protein
LLGLFFDPENGGDMYISSGFLIATAWDVLRWRIEETVSRYGGWLRIQQSFAICGDDVHENRRGWKDHDLNGILVVKGTVAINTYQALTNLPLPSLNAKNWCKVLHIISHIQLTLTKLLGKRM